ncbi:MAG TPA: MBOAT family O-acyltransferase [Usitatibacter sp.]|nr:MBOAT family O-acyltransferase [Usitatibacter sp.]
MLFNSYEFLLFFLPVVTAGYFLAHGLDSRLRGNDSRPLFPNLWLVAASFFFYAWWRAEYLWLLVVSITVNFFVGRAIVHRWAQGLNSRGLLVAGIAFDLLLLGYFKYANFFIANVSQLLGVAPLHLDVILPIGISFFTFTQIAFLVDASKGKAQEPDAVNYSLFVTYFPHLLAGPILHHREMMPQFADPTNKRVDWDNVARGLLLLAIGLGKKVLVADTLAQQVAQGFESFYPLGFADAWLVILCYTMQIYFDFSGYTDMALGMALMMNIRLPRNFDSPYRQRNLQEFWRHWHMTLTRFLRDYVYIPLGGNRRGEAWTACAIVITFLLGGLWHGANWTFVAWGLMNGVGLALLRSWPRAGIRLPAFVAWAITFAFVNLAWVLFRAPDLSTAGWFFKSLTGGRGFQGPRLDWPYYTLAVLGIACVLAALPRNSNRIAAETKLAWPWQVATALLLAGGILSLGNPTEFLYFNF